MGSIVSVPLPRNRVIYLLTPKTTHTFEFTIKNQTFPTILDLKQKLKDKENIPIDQQAIWLGQNELTDLELLDRYWEMTLGLLAKQMKGEKQE